MEGQENIANAKLTVTASIGLLQFIHAFAKKNLKPAFTQDLAAVLINITHNLFNTEEKLLKRVKTTMNFIKSLRNFDQEILFQVVEAMPQMSKNTFIPLLVSEFNIHHEALA